MDSATDRAFKMHKINISMKSEAKKMQITARKELGTQLQVEDAPRSQDRDPSMDIDFEINSVSL
jgi:hypothetical protein